MSTGENKAVVSRYCEEIWNEANPSSADDIVAPTYVYHGTPEVHGPSGLRAMVSGAHASFPDLHFTVEDLIAEGDKVVMRWQAVGTHEGEVHGRQGDRQEDDREGRADQPLGRHENRGGVGVLGRASGPAATWGHVDPTTAGR